MKLSVENAQKVLEKYLKYSNEKKYEHSLEVAKMAEQLAKKWRVNSEEAVIAALLHDIGKSIPTREEMLMFCEKHGIEISEFERDENPEALHGKISAYLFKEEFRDGENGERTNKLRAFILDTEKFDKLDNLNKDLMISQLKAMEAYISILSIRIGLNSKIAEPAEEEVVPETVESNE